MAPASHIIERRVMLRSRVADGYELTRIGLQHLQHIFTVWYPAAIFNDLTEDTVRVDVVVKKGNLSRQSVYSTTFVSADGSVIKTANYDEDRITGKVCKSYNLKRSGYFGKKNGFDYRNLIYEIRPTAKTPR
jgi:hypothetical protein